MNILELKQLSKKFGDYAAVDQMSLAVKKVRFSGFSAQTEPEKARRSI